MKTTFRLLAILMALIFVITGCQNAASGPSSVSSTSSEESSDPSSTASSTGRGDLIGPTGEVIGGGISDTVAEKKGDPETLTIIVSADPAKMDPQYNPLIIGIMIEKHIFDTLLEKDPITGEFIPGLATAWEWVDDTHLTLTLREGVKFHNGEDFTSADVLKTVQRFSEGTATSSLYEQFDGQNTTVNGDYEITIAFKSPFAPALNFLTHHRASIVPADYLAESGEEALNMAPIGTGAYKFVSWNIAADMTLERNDDWWGQAEGYGDCYFKNVHFLFSAEVGARAIALEAGEADLAFVLSSADYDKIFAGSTEHLLATSTSGLSVNYLAFTFDSAEWANDVKVRQALAISVDWKAAVEALGSAYSLSESCLAPAVFGYESQGAYEYNPEKAKELLKEAGYEEGFSVDLSVFEGNTAIVEIIQAYWAEIGVTLVPNVTDLATWSEISWNGNCDIQLLNMTAVTLDPAHTLLNSNAATACIPGRVTDENYNSIYSAGLGEFDLEKRAAVYSDLQKLIHDEVWQIPMFTQKTTYAYWDYLDGLIPNGGQQIDIRKMSLIQN